MSSDALHADALIAEHEGLCRTIAKDYFLPGGSMDDLVQEARIGLWKATRDFRPDAGASFRTFAVLCMRRQVITAVKTATRDKHIALNGAVSLQSRPPDATENEAVSLEDVLADGGLAAIDTVAQRQRLDEAASAFRERLTDVECASLVGWLNGLSFEAIAERLDVSTKTVDNALTRARWKLTGASTSTRRGAHGFTCPSCGKATVKSPGRGRPPRCNVCRVAPKLAAA